MATTKNFSLLLALTLAIAVQVYAMKPGTWHNTQKVVFKSRSSTGLKASKPHIMMMLVDDWGWANVGYHRNASDRETVTPNFDKLLKAGLELNQNYAFQACTPSRSSFLTGRLPIHVNDKLGSFEEFNPKDIVSGYQGIPRNMTGLGQKMKEGGYATHMIGKWDAGMATPQHTPEGRGFNTSLAYYGHGNDYYTEIDGRCKRTQIVDLWSNGKPGHGLNGTGPDNYEEGLFKERALDIIAKHDPSVPLFLYYAAHSIHTPLQVPESYLKMFDFIDNSDRQYYHAMVTYLDDVMGNITDALKTHGLWNNLLLVVSSDNGGPLYVGGGGNNYPLKGGKFSDWQGGVRVNGFVAGGFLPEAMRGKTTDGYIHIADWYATFCALAGVDPTDQIAAKADLPPVDSLNMWPFISGEKPTSPRDDVPISYNTLISGDYKILTGDVIFASWTGTRYPNNTTPPGRFPTEECGNGCLFNIKDDPEERNNLADSMPTMLKTMQSKLAAYQATYFNPDRGSQWPAACEYALNTYGGFWGPFLFVDSY